MKVLSCRGHELPIGDRTIIMGILNVTPDSFSDGGELHQGRGCGAQSSPNGGRRR